MKRAISVDQLMNMKFEIMDFSGNWEAFIGSPERSGAWLVWGPSGNGKTRFMLQLVKYLTQFGRVAYDTLEEGARASFQKAAGETNLMDVRKKLIILDREPIEELKVRLSKHKSPDIVVIDSFQYSGLNKTSYITLKEEFPNKLFIFNSHAEGKLPQGRPANFVRYDADVKIRVEGFKAFPLSRYGGGQPYTIWHKGAAEYWNDL